VKPRPSYPQLSAAAPPCSYAHPGPGPGAPVFACLVVRLECRCGSAVGPGGWRWRRWRGGSWPASDQVAHRMARRCSAGYREDGNRLQPQQPVLAVQLRSPHRRHHRRRPCERPDRHLHLNDPKRFRLRSYQGRLVQGKDPRPGPNRQADRPHGPGCAGRPEVEDIDTLRVFTARGWPAATGSWS
jgi:hypothetical protein